MMKLDIYNMPKKIGRLIQRIKEDKRISKRNKNFIFEFHRHCVLSNIGQKWLFSCIYSVRIIALSIKKDFDKVSKENIESYIQKLQESNYAPITKAVSKVILKKFYKWLKGSDGKYPVEVSWINTTIKRTDRHLPADADLLTEEEIKKLIDVSEHPRNKAFIAVLYESGCRVGEICSIRLKDVKFDDYGALIHVNGKTGPRQIRLISSVPFLSTWMNNHPLKDNRDWALWICVGRKRNKPLLYSGIYFILERAFKKAGIKKKFNPHLFRHSRATFLANHLTEFQMNQYFGWVQGSGMPSTYVHLSGKNVDGAILELNGIKTDKKESKESKLKPKICPRCDMINSFSDKFCGKCACALDVKTAMELDAKIKIERKERSVGDKLMGVLMQDREFQEMVVKKAEELGVNMLK